MQQFILYQFNFWRYLFVSVGIILSLIFGFIFSPLIEVIQDKGWGDFFIPLFAILSMALGIAIGVMVSANKYVIELDEIGIKINKVSRLDSQGMPPAIVLWNEITGILDESYYNGEIVRMQLRNPPFEYVFTNSILKRSDDLVRFYAIVKGRINAIK